MFHLSTPERVELDSKDTDLRRALALIAECDKKVLRVIYNVTTGASQLGAEYKYSAPN